ncbi:MAG: sigma-54-dependent Fis family transcriptional regulator [Deltaproteobacteria bacterium]|nr:sigma-54-dependent Fis family transcriptional regulator [Deltaproteobacteria bacterium]
MDRQEKESCTARILLAEDDEIMRITLSDHLRKHLWCVDEAEDGKAALVLLKENSYQLVLSDIRMPSLDGPRLLKEVKKRSPDTDVILMTAFGSTEDAVNCLKEGATDYILKPFDMDDLTIRVSRLLEMQKIKAKCISLEEKCREQHGPIVGSSAATRKVINLISQVALSNATVLVTGGSGTGKELVASAIHYSSNRADKPYVRINCAAIPEGLLESELFGHEKGAFTGAHTMKIGKFELAEGGSILLDEIGEMSLDLQAKLLRVLQEREIERVGGLQTIPINVRVICSTSRNLVDEVKKGAFREDLFYRLQVIPIEVPPLRERKEDIPDLCNYFLKEFGKEKRQSLSISPEAMSVLQSYDYPGNIRELKNIIERLTVLVPSAMVQAWDLPSDIRSEYREERRNIPLKLADAVAMAEKACIVNALKESNGNKTEASRLMGISRKNLWEKLKMYQM